MTCNCATSAYNYVPAEHVVTGDLRIVKDRRIRQLLMKGPQFREQNNINWNKNECLCKEAVRKYREKWCLKEKVDKRLLGGWLDEVNMCITERVKQLKQKCRCKQKKQIMKDKRQREFLEDLQKEYVLVPADKAANNIIVVCKKYYLEVVLEEMNGGGSNAYTGVAIPYLDILKNHLDYMEVRILKYPLLWRSYHPYTGYLNYIRIRIVVDLLLHQTDALLSHSQGC